MDTLSTVDRRPSTVDQAAERLGTSVRFVRRLVFQRRIAYVKLGRHVRIANHDQDFKSLAAQGLTLL